jgi:hypothetical protein
MNTIKEAAERYVCTKMIGDEEKTKKYLELGDYFTTQTYYGFIAGANEMLPIIKELGEALKEIQEANTGGVINTHWMQNHIQTTLDKYKQYL